MANKPGEANFFPDVPVYPEMGTFQPVYGKFDLTTYIQGASDYEIMAFLVGKYNACLEAYGKITKLSTDTITACKQLQDWINSWFTNLDVQEEINKKLDNMVQDGSFGRLLHQTFDAQINQQTTNTVTQWLVANVTPTGSAVVVDKSLSIEGAAADAKATGEGLNLKLFNLYNFRSLQTIKPDNYTVHQTNTNHISANFYNNDTPTTGSATGQFFGIVGELTETIPAASDFYLYFIGNFNFNQLALIVQDSNVDSLITSKAEAKDVTFIEGTSIYKVHMHQDNVTESSAPYKYVRIGGGFVPFSNFVCDMYILKDSVLYDLLNKTDEKLFNTYYFNSLQTIKPDNYTVHQTNTNHISANFYNNDTPTTGNGKGGFFGIVGELTETIPAASDFYLYFIGNFNFNQLALIVQDSNIDSLITSKAEAKDVTFIEGTSIYKVHMHQDNVTESSAPYKYVRIGGGYVPFSNFVCDMYILKDSVMYDLLNKTAEDKLFNTYYFNSLQTIKPNNYTVHQTNTNHISANFYNNDAPTTGSGTGGSFGIVGELTETIPAASDFYLYFIGNFNFNQLALTVQDSNIDSLITSKAEAKDVTFIEGTSIYKVHMHQDNVTESSAPYKYVRISGGYVPFSNFVCDMYILKGSALYDLLNKTADDKYDADIIFWGDSLTAGAGGNGTSYPSVCANELKKTALNMGIGGESAYTVAARQGGNNLLVYSKLNGITLSEMEAVFENIAPLRQGDAGVNPIIIDGQECQLTITQSSSDSGDATYAITGYSGTLKAKEPVAFNGSHMKGKVTVIFVGQNGPMEYNKLSTVIDSMISKTNGKYIIMGLSTGTKTQREELEEQMLTKYGNNYFNTREMVSQYGMNVVGLRPTETDSTEIASGTIPSSLRSDGVHLNASGYTALGKMLANKIRSLGFFS